MQAAAEARQKKARQNTAEGGSHGADDFDSPPDGGASKTANRKTGKKATFADDQGDGAVEVSVQTSRSKMQLPAQV